MKRKKDARIIDSKLVSLYMNRFIINEDAQNKIIRVYLIYANHLCIKKIVLHLSVLIVFAANTNCLYGQESNVHLTIGYHS